MSGVIPDDDCEPIADSLQRMVDDANRGARAEAEIERLTRERDEARADVETIARQRDGAMSDLAALLDARPEANGYWRTLAQERRIEFLEKECDRHIGNVRDRERWLGECVDARGALRRERDSARAEVARMRPVVAAARRLGRCGFSERWTPRQCDAADALCDVLAALDSEPTP